MKAVMLIGAGILLIAVGAMLETWGKRRSRSLLSFLGAGYFMTLFMVAGLVVLGFGVAEAFDLGRNAPTRAPQLVLPLSPLVRDGVPVYQVPTFTFAPFSREDLARGFLFAEIVDDDSYNQKTVWADLKRGYHFPSAKRGNTPDFAAGGLTLPFVLPVRELRESIDKKYWIRFGLVTHPPRPVDSQSLTGSLARGIDRYFGTLWLSLGNRELVSVEWTRFAAFWVAAEMK